MDIGTPYSRPIQTTIYQPDVSGSESANLGLALPRRECSVATLQQSTDNVLTMLQKVLSKDTSPANFILRIITGWAK